MAHGFIPIFKEINIICNKEKKIIKKTIEDDLQTTRPIKFVFGHFYY